MFDRRLEPHDSNQLELKLAYGLEANKKRQRYLVESFIYVPRTLGVGSASYDSRRFFEDTSTFVRLKTPTVALEALAKTGRAERFFEPIQSGLDGLLSGRRMKTTPLVRQLKLLGTIYRAAIRDEGRMWQTQLEEVGHDEHHRQRDLASKLDRFADHLNAALARLRTAGERCVHAAVPPVVSETWGVVDEYAAIYAEEIATAIVATIDGIEGPADELTAARERLADIAIAEYRHRRELGYPSYAIPGEPNEELPRRRRILKRIISSVLFLDTNSEEGGNIQRDLVAAVAAAAAMLFAILVAIWAQIEWGILSTTFVIIMVASYIIKDRIKDWGKRFLGRRLAKFMPDRVVRVRDPDSERVIGHCRESVSVVDPSRVAADLNELRHADHLSAVAEHGRPEAVIRYVKDVTLDSKRLTSALPGVDGLTDVMRFNFSHLRTRMDEPVETYRIVHPTHRTILEVPCARVYHINFILRITAGRGRSKRTVTERVRVIIDQSGIQRAESVIATFGDRTRVVAGVTQGAPQSVM